MNTKRASAQEEVYVFGIPIESIKVIGVIPGLFAGSLWVIYTLGVLLISTAKEVSLLALDDLKAHRERTHTVMVSLANSAMSGAKSVDEMAHSNVMQAKSADDIGEEVKKISDTIMDVYYHMRETNGK